MTNDRVLFLIDRIYAAAEDPKLWPVFLEDLSEAMRSKMTALVYQDTNRLSAAVSSVARLPLEAIPIYEEHYASRNVFFTHRARGLPSGAVLSDSDIPERTLLHSEYYGDFLVPHDVRYAAGLVITNDNGVLSILSTMRSKRDGAFDEPEFALLAMLRPHMQRAWQLHRRLYAADQRVLMQADALDLLDTGVILIDGSGEVVLMNRAAEKIVSFGDAITMRDRRLIARESESKRKLATLIARALKTSAGAGFDSAGGIAVPRPSGRLDVIVIPLGTDRARDHANVAVLICDPQSNDGQRRLLSALYGLTEAESRVATTIATGVGVPVVAARLGLTANTVRTHLKHVFAKTGTRRQAALAGLLRSTRIAGN